MGREGKWVESRERGKRDREGRWVRERERGGRWVERTDGREGTLVKRGNR